ncbi:uncharacterized protein F5Z01DRAFT_623038, partial [Emericellopsis atlantica]
MSTGPRSRSYEAIYPFVVAGQRLAYHANPNVQPVSYALNNCKGRSGPLALVVTAEWMRTTFVYGDTGLSAQKARWRWCYNAMTNVRIMDIATGSHYSKKIRQTQWGKWSPDFTRAVLESLRTGVLSSEMREVIDTKERSRYFKIPLRSMTELGRTIQPRLHDIADHYGISADEFDECFTIMSPHSPGLRVFFPFHVTARKDAVALGWDWQYTLSAARSMLQRMRSACNRLAEAAGLGEKGMDKERVLYWICHVLCRQAAFGLPRLPWDCSPCKISLCHDQEHGIAMLFGLDESRGTFDHVQSFDLAKATVCLDTKAANMAMWDFHPSEWFTVLRPMLLQVPLYHPFWRPDESLGDASWLEPVSTEPEFVVPPFPQFEVPLVSLDGFLDGRTNAITNFPCGECEETFATPGDVMAHGR